MTNKNAQNQLGVSLSGQAMESLIKAGYEIKFTSAFSSLPEMFSRVDRLIDLAQKQDEIDRSTLIACATVMLAASLEQGVWHRLERIKVEKSASILFAEILLNHRDVSFWERVRALPEILSYGKYKLDDDECHNNHIKALHELIRTRNDLAHPGAGDVVETIRVKAANTVTHLKKKLKIPWKEVSLESLEKYREAVRIYEKEVLLKEFGKIRGGKLVRRIGQ